jgi:hypothetical protein
LLEELMLRPRERTRAGVALDKVSPGVHSAAAMEMQE